MKPSDIRNQTPYLEPNEKAMGLVEVEMNTLDSKGVHRYQIVYVVRSDKVAAHVSDLGSSLLYPNPPLNIVSLMEHSVAELLDMAGEARDRSDVRQRLQDLQDEATSDRKIIKEFLDRKDQYGKIVKNQSHHGPTVKRQAIGFPRRHVSGN